MTHSDLPPDSVRPEPTVDALHARYHAAARAEPGPLLDKAILDAARAELRSAEIKKSRRPTRWWQGWLPATTALAAVVAGLSITWRVMDEQERRLHEEISATQAAGASANNAKSAQRPAAAVLKSLPAVKEESPQRRDASTATEAAPSLRPRSVEREAGGLGATAGNTPAADSLARPPVVSSATATAGSVAGAAGDAATPEAWLQQINEMRAAGRNAEAVQSLARFRARYPDFALPEDLLNFK